MNLVEMIGKYLPSDMTSKLGAASGLGSDQTKKLAPAAVPLVAAGLAQVGSTEEGAGKLLDLARQSGAEDTVGRFGEMVGSAESRRTLVENGGGILSSLLGSRKDNILGAVTAATGAPRQGTQTFLSMLAPLALGVLGRYVRSQGLGPAGLASMLSGQSSLLTNMVPGGLGRLLGGGGPVRESERWERSERYEEGWKRETPPEVRATEWRETTSTSSDWQPEAPTQRTGDWQREVPSTTEPVRGAEPRRWAVPAVALLIGLAFLTWALLRQRRPGEQQASRLTPNVTQPAEPATGTGSSATGTGSAQAAGGENIDALAGYSGANIEGKRFSIKNISFGSGGSNLGQASARQVDLLAGAMKERSGMRVRLEGERADSVRDALAARGIAVERVDTTKTIAGQAGPVQDQVDVVVVGQ